MNTKTSLIVMAVVMLWSSAASAGGFRIVSQSASAAGQSDAFVAQADDASAIYFNPAGMTQIRGIQMQAGTTLFGGSTSFRSPSGAASRGDFGGSVVYPPPTQFFLTANLPDLGLKALGNLSAGIGVVFPFGTKYRWPEDGPFATAVTTAALQTINIKPTIAYRVHEKLSLGLGLDIYTFTGLFGEGQYEQRLISSGGPGLPPAGVPIEINGKDTALGFNASLMYWPLLTEVRGVKKPLASIGIIYRSQATLHLDGEFLAGGTHVSTASTTLVLPQVITGGIAVWPIRDERHDWKLELDVDMTGWKSIRNLDVHLPSGTIPYAQNWRNSFMVMIGTEYKWLQLEQLPEWEVAARAGYWFSQTPIPDAAFNPVVPDADHHSISVGLGLLCKGGGHVFAVSCGAKEGPWYAPKALGLDLAYQALLYEVRTVTGNANPVAIPSVVDGRYHSTFHVGVITVKAQF